VRKTTSGPLEVAFLTSRTNSRVLVITDNFTDYAYGDRLELVGKVERPQNFRTDQGTIFDYQNYLAVRGIGQVAYQPKLKIVTRGEGSIIKSQLFSLKNNFLKNLRRALPEPSASLAGGLILGDKGGLGKKVETEFRQAGVSHIVVLSGYNITIVAENVLVLFSWLSPTLAWLFGIVSIFLFVLMVGGEAAVVRAAVMGAIALVARRYGRAYDAGVALIVAGFLMILWNPRLLAFDLGFQLSFLATLGLIYLSPVVEFFINKISRGVLDKIHLSALKEIIVTTTGAQLTVYPWLLYKVGNVSLVGFVSNIFVLPVIPLAMLGSFLTGVTGFIFSPLSSLLSYPTYFLLTYVLKTAHFFASLL
ncbi:MAG TPA: ComEC/Rec2 family competence protein, partial [Candidatus Paceibacterota bacterium]|nr:ComEC/Rec2 family competence protein [Candidatus Paceibacterota bacterium]